MTTSFGKTRFSLRIDSLFSKKFYVMKLQNFTDQKLPTHPQKKFVQQLVENQGVILTF